MIFIVHKAERYFKYSTRFNGKPTNFLVQNFFRVFYNRVNTILLISIIQNFYTHTYSGIVMLKILKTLYRHKTLTCEIRFRLFKRREQFFFCTLSVYIRQFIRGNGSKKLAITNQPFSFWKQRLKHFFFL